MFWIWERGAWTKPMSALDSVWMGVQLAVPALLLLFVFRWWLSRRD